MKNELRVWVHHIYCSLCGDIMILREPRNNQQHYEKFWGCRSYPDCNGTRAILPDGSIEPEVWELDNLDWI